MIEEILGHILLFSAFWLGVWVALLLPVRFFLRFANFV